jgi:caffeoyl-CoA O-methyltransferase
MSPRSFLLPQPIADYVLAHTEPADPVQADLIERTRALGDVAGMQVGVDQARLLTTLTRFAGVTRAVEVGTFTGMSALAIARGLAPGGRLLCCDVSDEWISIAREAWGAAGVDDRIEVRLGPAGDTLRSLSDDPVIDLAFIDADKTGYLHYFEALVPRMRPGGLLIADNTLWSGTVCDPTNDDESTEALRRYNDVAASDDRVDTVLLPLADGLTVCQRR